MPMYKVTLRNDTEGLAEAASLRAARSAALRENGRANLRDVRPASEADVSWIRAMGGHVPGRVRDAPASPRAGRA